MAFSGRENSVDEVFVRREVIDAAKLRRLCVASNGAGDMERRLRQLGFVRCERSRGGVSLLRRKSPALEIAIAAGRWIEARHRIVDSPTADG